MKSRAISALIFGLVFGILVTIVTLFFPPIEKVSCGTETSYKIFSVEIGSTNGCTGGSSSRTIGFPFATRKDYQAPTINYVGLSVDNPSHGLEFQPAGIIGNFAVYGAIGFVFFFIFSRSRTKSKS